MDELIKQIGTTHLYSTPYHPQTNGQVERYNSTMDAKIAALSNLRKTDWDDQLPFVTFNYNTSIHSSTKQIPLEMMYGRSPVLPFDHQDTHVTLSYDPEHSKKLNQFLLKLNEQAKINIIKNQERYKQRYDKLHEHEFASRFPPFQHYHYQQYFINYNTSEQTLQHLIEAVKNSTSFTLDIESVCIPYQPNKPALIQLQVIQENLFSYVIMIKVCHLPHENTEKFQLIRELFGYLFDPNIDIYVWGSIDVLEKFMEFHLFSSNQIYRSNNINSQDYFKNYWQDYHPHQLILSSTTNDTSCTCETCLGIQLNIPWSLQDVVGYLLNQWLDKRYTSIHQILVHTNVLNNEQQTRESSQQPELNVDLVHELEIIISNDLTPKNQHTSPQQPNQATSVTTVLIQNTNNNINDLEDISSDDDNEQ
ncbi:unnamed protein product [Rotaria socialis]|nr:unnamed protein product [Rotaria socialis]CAF4568015.1 unnamed protein product [Rotaria socialis]